MRAATYEEIDATPNADSKEKRPSEGGRRPEERRERMRENEWGKESASTRSSSDNGSLIRAYPLSLSSTL